jgi:Abortive infection alpha
MSSDEKGKSIKETIADEAKGIAVEVYKDVAKPVVAPIGETLGSVTRLVLWPIRLALDSANAALDRLSAHVERKLMGVPAERRQLPPATIAGPAALHYALLGEGEETSDLREMFENLLVSSMDSETANAAHPAFIAIIQQLTPAEAKIIRSMNRNNYAIFIMFPDMPKPARRWASLGTAMGIEEPKESRYISNLERLGIVRVSGDHSGLEITEDEIEQARLKVENTPREKVHIEGQIIVTPFGGQFLDICVRSHAVVPGA